MNGNLTSTGVQTIIYPVRDITAAKTVFTALLGLPTVDEAYYVGFDAAGQHIGLNPHGHVQGMTGPLAYWHVADIGASLAELIAAGATEQERVKDVGGGRLVASVIDPDDNPIGLLQDRKSD